MLRDGLLRGACHRARIRATRWLAMTGQALRSDNVHWNSRHNACRARPRKNFFTDFVDGMFTTFIASLFTNVSHAIRKNHAIACVSHARHAD